MINKTELEKTNSIDKSEQNKFPVYGIIGIILVIVFWYLNWNLKGLRTDWAFFPLWLGYCLTIDAITYKRKGDSLLKRNGLSYFFLFLFSVPVWWLFELFNLRMQNWDYIGKQYFTDFQFFILASISFSIVIPAVFETAEFVRTFIKAGKKEPEHPTKNSTIKLIFSLGLIFLIAILIFPTYFYYLIWISVYFILDPINVWLRNKNLLVYFSNKNFIPIKALSYGCLICGFFWEMWNYFSYPKWVYHLPMVNFMHIFEMPLLGYIGYIPFSFELFAIYQLLAGMISKKRFENYIKID
jgi:hypothetical protein